MACVKSDVSYNSLHLSSYLQSSIKEIFEEPEFEERTKSIECQTDKIAEFDHVKVNTETGDEV